MTRVVIESPLNDLTRELIEENKKYARRCMLDSLRRGEAPFASHVLYDHPDILDDMKPEERMLGITAGFYWGEMAELVAVYTDRGISSGMKRGIEFYRTHKIPVEYRSLSHAGVHREIPGEEPPI